MGNIYGGKFMIEFGRDHFMIIGLKDEHMDNSRVREKEAKAEKA